MHLMWNLRLYRLYVDKYHPHENDLVINCKVRANPRATITWLRDEQLIEFDERTQHNEHLDGVCEIIIHKPTIEDSGIYSCTATNSMGTANLSHQVDYQPYSSKRGHLSGEGDAESGENKPERPPPSEKVEETYESYRPGPPTREELLKAK